MLQTMMACARLAEAFGEAEHVGPRQSGAAFQRPPRRELRDLGLELVPAAGALGDEVAVDPVVLDQMLQHAVEEGDVAAGMDLEEVVGDPGAEQRAFASPTAPSSDPGPARDRD